MLAPGSGRAAGQASGALSSIKLAPLCTHDDECGATSPEGGTRLLHPGCALCLARLHAPGRTLTRSRAHALPPHFVLGLRAGAYHEDNPLIRHGRLRGRRHRHFRWVAHLAARPASPLPRCKRDAHARHGGEFWERMVMRHASKTTLAHAHYGTEAPPARLAGREDEEGDARCYCSLSPAWGPTAFAMSSPASSCVARQ